METTRSDRLKRFRGTTPAILPSLLQCDFGDLQGEVDRLGDAGVQVLHLDVMDGHFVPNLTYGMPIVSGLRRRTDMLLDVHLMISDPSAYIGAFADAGADMLTFHIEAASDPAAVIEQIHARDILAGIALNPNTSLERILPHVASVDAVLVMSVEAGFGGQSFHPEAIDRLRQLRRQNPDMLLEVDGGIKPETIGPCHAAGCDLFVVGSAIFGQDDYRSAIAQLRAAMSTDSTLESR